ncbi:MAG: hypothetical protein ACTSSH_00705 [Candidatus Heimdallarchaeota archaeon]
MSKMKLLNKTLQRKLSKPDITRSRSLNIILTELKKKGSLKTCILTDSSGLVLAQVLARGDNVENLSASTGLIQNNAERMADYLGTGTIALSYFVSKDVMIWVTPFTVAATGDNLILLVSKQNSILEKMSKSTLKLLGKQKTNVYPLIEIAIKWLTEICCQ